MTDAPSAPYVSIVLTGRNDGHGGDFTGRLLATLAFNHRELSAREIPHEFVLVEWAAPAGKPLLADLVDERHPAVGQVLQTIVVDEEYQDALTLNPRLRYHEFIAKNVGIRRARGRYIVVTNCDTFFGRRILDRLQRRELEPAIVFRAARHDLKAGTDYTRISWDVLENPANLARAKRLRAPVYAGGTGDFIGLDRASFERLGGFNEVYRVVRVGIDRNFLTQAVARGLRIADLGGPVYHVDHEGSLRVTKGRYAGREWEAPYGDRRWPLKSVSYRNRDGWGLADAPARAIGPRRTRLQFSWQAVPPLVDLAGVIAPVRAAYAPALQAVPAHE